MFRLKQIRNMNRKPPGLTLFFISLCHANDKILIKWIVENLLRTPVILPV
jgi:hypothetical protein